MALARKPAPRNRNRRRPDTGLLGQLPPHLCRARCQTGRRHRRLAGLWPLRSSDGRADRPGNQLQPVGPGNRDDPANRPALVGHHGRHVSVVFPPGLLGKPRQASLLTPQRTPRRHRPGLPPCANFRPPGLDRPAAAAPPGSHAPHPPVRYSTPGSRTSTESKRSRSSRITGSTSALRVAASNGFSRLQKNAAAIVRERMLGAWRRRN